MNVAALELGPQFETKLPRMQYSDHHLTFVGTVAVSHGYMFRLRPVLLSSGHGWGNAFDLVSFDVSDV